jgi:hypothetical protein
MFFQRAIGRAAQKTIRKSCNFRERRLPRSSKRPRKQWGADTMLFVEKQECSHRKPASTRNAAHILQAKPSKCASLLALFADNL